LLTTLLLLLVNLAHDVNSLNREQRFLLKEKQLCISNLPLLVWLQIWRKRRRKVPEEMEKRPEGKECVGNVRTWVEVNNLGHKQFGLSAHLIY